MRRLLVVISGLLLAWVGLANTAEASAGVSGLHRPSYDCATLSSDAPENYTASERGPPLGCYADTTYDAVDPWSDGASACSESTSTPGRPITYDASATLAQLTRATGTPQPKAQRDAGAALALPSAVAAKSADEFVDLASTARRNHILYGDATGGGHLWPGLPGKTPFPKDWSADRVMHEVSDVATDPGSIFRTGRGGSTIVTGTRDGVDIRVILRNGNIITGYPTNLLRNP